MQLKSCKKTYNLETQRAAPLEETLAALNQKSQRRGDNEVASRISLTLTVFAIQGLSCIRPTAEAGSI